MASPQPPSPFAAMYARISASRPPSGAIAAFAGGALDTTLFSCCSGALLACLDTATALPLRAACRELRDAVARHPWATDVRRPICRGNVEAWRVGLPLEDLRAGGGTPLTLAGTRESRASLLDWASAVPRAQGARLAQWRACFPHAVAARLDASRVRDEDLVSLRGAAEVLLDRTLERILPQLLLLVDRKGGWDSDNQWLTLPPAPLPTFSDAALQQLAGVRVLSLRGCCQLTDAALAPLAPALRDLDVSYCTQLTDAALAPLSGLCVLAVGGCTGVTDAALARLAPQLRALDIAHCPQLTGAAFASALRLERLRMRGCSQSSIADAHFAGLQSLAELDMSRCTQATLTPALFEALVGLRVLIADSVEGIPEHVWRRLYEARGVEEAPATWRGTPEGVGEAEAATPLPPDFASEVLQRVGYRGPFPLPPALLLALPPPRPVHHWRVKRSVGRGGYMRTRFSFPGAPVVSEETYSFTGYVKLEFFSAEPLHNLLVPEEGQWELPCGVSAGWVDESSNVGYRQCAWSFALLPEAPTRLVADALAAQTQAFFEGYSLRDDPDSAVEAVRRGLVEIAWTENFGELEFFSDAREHFTRGMPKSSVKFLFELGTFTSTFADHERSWHLAEGQGAPPLDDGRSDGGGQPPLPFCTRQQAELYEQLRALAFYALATGGAAAAAAAGFPAEALLRLGLPLAQLRAAGVALPLLATGLSARALRAAGATVAELRAAGLPLVELLPTGTLTWAQRRAHHAADSEARKLLPRATPSELLPHTSLPELLGGGATLGELAAAGASPYALCEAGATAPQLLAAGIPPAQLLRVCSLPALQACGVSLAQLKEGGCSAASLLASGAAPAQLLALGYTLTSLCHAPGKVEETAVCGGAELVASGATALQLRQAGASLRYLLHAGFPSPALEAAGYARKEVQQLQQELVLHRCELQRLRRLRSKERLLYDSASLLLTAQNFEYYGFRDSPGLRRALQHCTALAWELDQHATVGHAEKREKGTLQLLRQLEIAGAEPCDLLRAGYTAPALEAAGYTREELKELEEEGQLPASEEEELRQELQRELRQELQWRRTSRPRLLCDGASLLAAGASLSDLVGAGASPALLHSTGLPAAAFVAAGVPLAQIVPVFSARELLEAGASLSDLVGAGASPASLRSTGLPAAAFVAAGVPLAQIVPVFSARELLEAGASLSDLVGAGASLTSLRSTGLPAAAFVAAGVPLAQLARVFSARELLEAGAPASAFLALGVPLLVRLWREHGVEFASVEDLLEIGATVAELGAAGISQIKLANAAKVLLLQRVAARVPAGGGGSGGSGRGGEDGGGGGGDGGGGDGGGGCGGRGGVKRGAEPLEGESGGAKRR